MTNGYAGGSTADSVAKWDGTSWSGLGSNGAGDGAILSGGESVSAIALSGSDVYVGGGFEDAAGNLEADAIAEFSGGSWLNLGSNGAGDGPLGGIGSGGVYALATSPSGLYTGGFFNNAAGLAKADNVAEWSLTAATPSAPLNPSASAGDASATVSWTEPSSTGGSTITTYTVTSSPGAKTCTWSTGPLSCTVTGLTNGTTYTFTVTDHNAAGDGPASAASNSVTPKAASDTTPPVVSPPSFAIVAQSSLTTTAKVTVSWPPATDASGIDHYQLQEKKGTGSWTTVSLPAATATSVTLSLAPATYTFRLRATDSANHNTSAWLTTASHKLSLVQENASAITYTGSWKRKALSGSSGGDVKFASASGAKADCTFTGSSVALVTTTGPG